MISHASNEVGSQSVVVILDVRRKLLGGYQVYTHNGTKDTSYKLKNLVENLSNRGAGELIINSIDNDGIMGGYDINIIKSIKDNVSIPITLIGGAGSIEHIKQLVDEFHIVGAAAGSMFVFQGKYKAVLITYPNQKDKNYIFDSIINYKWEF